MKTPLRLLLPATLLLLTACSTVESRIASNRALFDQWPAAVQAKVQARQIDVGFRPEMVLVALGDPDGKATRTTAAGTAEVWTYLDHGPKFSIGLGMGSSHGHTAYAGGVAVGSGGEFRDDELLRVIFEGGVVAAIETRQR